MDFYLHFDANVAYDELSFVKRVFPNCGRTSDSDVFLFVRKFRVCTKQSHTKQSNTKQSNTKHSKVQKNSPIQNSPENSPKNSPIDRSDNCSRS